MARVREWRRNSLTLGNDVRTCPCYIVTSFLGNLPIVLCTLQKSMKFLHRHGLGQIVSLNLRTSFRADLRKLFSRFNAFGRRTDPKAAAQSAHCADDGHRVRVM